MIRLLYGCCFKYRLDEWTDNASNGCSKNSKWTWMDELRLVFDASTNFRCYSHLIHKWIQRRGRQTMKDKKVLYTIPTRLPVFTQVSKSVKKHHSRYSFHSWISNAYQDLQVCIHLFSSMIIQISMNLFRAVYVPFSVCMRYWVKGMRAYALLEPTVFVCVSVWQYRPL